MRRIAAVFASRRTDKSDSALSQSGDHPSPPEEEHANDHLKPPVLARPKSRFFRTLSRRAPTLSSPLITDHAPSSSSSSSAGPTTPDDDARSLHRAKHFLHPFPDKALPASPTTVHEQARPVVPSLPARHPPNQPQHRTNYADDETSESDGSSDVEPPAPPPRTHSAINRPAISQAAPPMSAIQYARAIVTDALVPSFSPPPLLHVPGAPLFPRSCNTRSALSASTSDALLPQLFHKRLLSRLANATAADQRALAPFAGRQRPPRPRVHFQLDDTAVGDARRVERVSEGLRRWTARPCFEDRFAVYFPAEDGADAEWTHVQGTGLGVAALEYSETLELLAGLYAEDDEPGVDVVEDAREKPGQMPPSAVQFPRVVLPENEPDAGAEAQSPDTHAFTAWAADVLGSLRVDGPKHIPTTSGTPMLTPPLSFTPSSGSPESSGPPTPTGAVPLVPAQGQAQPSGVPPPSASPRGQPYKAMPSPLRIEQNMRLPSPWSPADDALAVSISRTSSASPAPTSTSTSTSTATVTPLQAAQPVPSSQPPPTRANAKPAVRFAESESDSDSESERKDNVPLGYVQRIQQQRLEKARFLAAERKRRAQQEAEARRKMEEEERRRADKEREKREREEERRRRMYAEEVLAARSRRESMRFVAPALAGVSGAVGSPSAGLGEWGTEKERERERRDSAGRGRGRDNAKEREDKYARPVYDARRQSEPGVKQHRNASPAPPPPPLPVSSHSPSARNSSPAPSGNASGSGSQRGSSAHSHLAPPPHPGALGSGNRSSSAPDVRPREQRSGSSSSANRASMVSDAGTHGNKERTASFSSNPPSPLWMASPGSPMGMNMGMNRMSMNMGMMNIPMMAVPMPVPVPVPMPGYGMPMGMEPLLPPTPPFVMQQFGYRPPSQQSQHQEQSHGQGHGSGSGSSASQGQRRAHSSSPTPPQTYHRTPEQQQQQQQQQPRAHSSSPTSHRPSRDAFPPSSSRGAVRANESAGNVQSHSPGLRTEASPSSPRAREYTHHRRSSADVDVNRLSQVHSPPVPASRSEHGKERDERRKSSGRPPAQHSSSMPPPLPTSPSSPPIVVTEPRNSWATPSSGFQILSRPAHPRRQTIIS